MLDVFPVQSLDRATFRARSNQRAFEDHEEGDQRSGQTTSKESTQCSNGVKRIVKRCKSYYSFGPLGCPFRVESPAWLPNVRLTDCIVKLLPDVCELWRFCFTKRVHCLPWQLLGVWRCQISETWMAVGAVHSDDYKEVHCLYLRSWVCACELKTSHICQTLLQWNDSLASQCKPEWTWLINEGTIAQIFKKSSPLGIVRCFGLAWARHFIEQMDPTDPTPPRSSCAMS